VSEFHETNVRTYVHRQGREPGIWFFSLEAANALAVSVARWRWHLPYHHADMRIERSGDRIVYESRRTHPKADGMFLRVEALIEEADGADPVGGVPTVSQPGTLEHFLLERYLMYIDDGCGRLLQGQVHHAPYAFRAADILHVEESLLAASNLETSAPPCHAVFSEGVNVEIFSLERASGRTI
jgi:uncharacterized protein YqjF (DUF2071 family)